MSATHDCLHCKTNPNCRAQIGFFMQKLKLLFLFPSSYSLYNQSLSGPNEIILDGSIQFWQSTACGRNTRKSDVYSF
jgi:hypothetical protein